MGVVADVIQKLVHMLVKALYALMHARLWHRSTTSSTQQLIADTSRLPQLPVEVCELIIDFVNASFVGFNHETDIERRNTLRACSLVCRCWRPRSQLHLYHFVVLDDKKQLELWARSIRQNPELATYIHDVSLRGNRDGLKFPSGVEQWTSLIALALSSLTQVDRFTLKWCDWRFLHPSFFTMVSSIPSITQLILTSIQLHSSRELVHFFHSFPNLQCLLLLDVYCSKIQPYSRRKRVKRTRVPLKSLEVSQIQGSPSEAIASLFPALVDSGSSKQLTHLKVKAMQKDTQFALDSFLSSCEMLEELDLYLVMDLLKPG